MITYRRINWQKPSQEITESTLWKFNLAIKQRAKETDRQKESLQLWSQATLQSLIEIKYNEEFVIAAGLAYEKDVETGGREFHEFRKATGYAAPNDEEKSDTLRTSPAIISSSGETRHLAYHPHLSFNTLDLPIENRKAQKRLKFSVFFNGIEQLWQRIERLPDRQKKTMPR